MKILLGRGERDLESGESPARDRERWLVDPPHRAIGGENDVRRKQVLVFFDKRIEARAPDLLLAFEETLDVDRQRASRGKERLRDLDGDEHRPFVVRHASGVESSVANSGRECLALPLL